MKKIAVIGIRGIPATYGGIEKHCEELYSIMTEKGFNITVYARNYYNENNLKEYKGIKIKSIPVLNIKGYETFIHSFMATVMATFSDAQILHFHAQGPALFSCIPKIFTPCKKIVFTCHGIDKDREKWGKLGKFVITFGEIASALFPHKKIGVSQGLSDYYKRKYNVEMTTIYNGVSIDEPLALNNTKKFDIEPNNYFMFVGRLVPEKAPDILIEAFKKVDTDKKLLIVGDAAGTDSYVKQLKELASGDNRIIFTSYVYGDDLKELYSNAFAYISASKLEGLPLTVLEAMSFSLPVLLSNISPHIEILSQGYNVGDYFQVNDINACKDSIEKMLSLPYDKINAMKNSSKESVQNVFSWEKAAVQTVNIINSTTK